MRIVVLIFLLAAMATAQIPGVAVNESGGWAFTSPYARAPGGRAVTGMPYSAQRATVRVQVLADGTRITQANDKETIYRDSQGRTRTERIAPQGPDVPSGTPDSIASIDILDPANGIHYMLNPRNHTARELSAPRGVVPQAFPAPPPPPANARPAFFSPNQVVESQKPRPEVTHESLGTRTLEGVLASGNRTTTTYPVGFVGNDRPFSETTEIWTSTDLGMIVLMKISDPRTGDTTTAMTNISRAEPDPSLFQVPPDYQITNPR
jgi:hypothetical protein